MDFNQIVGLVCLLLFFLYFSDVLAADLFRRKKEFSIAEFEDLSDGEYSILETRSSGLYPAILISQKMKGNYCVGPKIAVFVPVTMSYLKNIDLVKSFEIKQNKGLFFLKFEIIQKDKDDLIGKLTNQVCFLKRGEDGHIPFWDRDCSWPK